MPKKNNEVFQCPRCKKMYSTSNAVIINLPFLKDGGIIVGCIDCFHKYIAEAAAEVPRIPLKEDALISLLGNVKKRDGD